VERERPTASDVQQTLADLDGAISDASRPARGALDDGGALSHAQMRALRRCAPLTSAEFEAHWHVAEKRQGLLRRISGRAVDDRVPRSNPAASR